MIDNTTYNKYVGLALSSIAQSYVDQVSPLDVDLAIENEDDQVMIVHVYNEMKKLDFDCTFDELMDHIIEEFSSPANVTEYKNIITSFVHIFTKENF